MITIIKPGNTKTVTCLQCNCVMSYHPSDVKSYYDFDGVDEHFYIRCPCCNRYVSVPKPEYR